MIRLRELGPGIVIAATGLGAGTRSTTAADPRDDQDLLSDIFHINSANGLNDHQEIGYVVNALSVAQLQK